MEGGWQWGGGGRKRKKCTAVVLVLSQVKDLINMGAKSQPPPPPPPPTGELITAAGRTVPEQTAHTHTCSEVMTCSKQRRE